MRILFVAGGASVGHVAPAVAVWRSAMRLLPQAETRFLCADRAIPRAFLEKERIPFVAMAEGSGPIGLLSSWLHARTILREFRPDAVFSKGGALSVPVCLAAKMAGIPIMLHESDAVSGRANRLVSRWARVVCTGFPETIENEELRMKNVIFTGNPIRPEVTHGDRKKGLALTGLSGTRPILLVMGGSQGALALNEAMNRHALALLQHVDIVHLTGKGKPGMEQRQGYWSTEFAYEELPHLYAIADLALSRSGAGSIAELAACGIPTLLVPLRGLAQDHQLRNAEAAVRSGGCVLLQQEELDKTLVRSVSRLAGDKAERERMSHSIRALAALDAAGKIAETVMALSPAHHDEKAP